MFSLHLHGQDEGVVLIDTVDEEWSRERGEAIQREGEGVLYWGWAADGLLCKH